MKLPTIDDALAVIGNLAGLGPTVKAATGAVNLIIDLFDGSPHDQAALKAKWEETEKAALASLDRLDAAIEDAKKDD